MLLLPDVALSVPLFNHQSFLLCPSAVGSALVEIDRAVIFVNPSHKGCRSARRLARTATLIRLLRKVEELLKRKWSTAVIGSRLCAVIDRSSSSIHSTRLPINENKTSSQSKITPTRLPKNPGSTRVIRCAMDPLVPGARPT